MKKFLVVLVVLTVALGGVFAAVVDTDILMVYGSIGAGSILFETTQTSTSKIDLISNNNMQLDGDGVEVGYWEFFTTSQPVGSAYKIEYQYPNLISPTTNSTGFAFEIVEEVVIGEDFYNTGTKTISFDGSTAIKTLVLVRLSEAVPPETPPALDYTSTITVNLTTVN